MCDGMLLLGGLAMDVSGPTPDCSEQFGEPFLALCVVCVLSVASRLSIAITRAPISIYGIVHQNMVPYLAHLW